MSSPSRLEWPPTAAGRRTGRLHHPHEQVSANLTELVLPGHQRRPTRCCTPSLAPGKVEVSQPWRAAREGGPLSLPHRYTIWLGKVVATAPAVGPKRLLLGALSYGHSRAAGKVRNGVRDPTAQLPPPHLWAAASRNGQRGMSRDGRLPSGERPPFAPLCVSGPGRDSPARGRA